MAKTNTCDQQRPSCSHMSGLYSSADEGRVFLLSKKGVVTMDIGEILKQRNASIESNTNEVSNNNSIEALPEEISSLITGSEYWYRAKENRYRMLVRQGYLPHLMELAKFCKRVATKDPSFLFAKMASKAKWEQTVKFCEKLIKIARTAADIAKRLAVPAKSFKAVYKACWRFKDAVISKAALAEELATEKGGIKLKWFNYLCWSDKNHSPKKSLMLA